MVTIVSKSSPKNKNLKLKRLLAIFLGGICVLSAAGCGISTKKSALEPLKQDTHASKEATIEAGPLSAKQWLNSQPNGDFGGYEFTVVTAKEGVFVPVDDGLMQQAVNDRNDWVSVKYNVTFKTKVLSESSYYTEVRNAQQAQNIIGDLLIGPASELSKLVSERLLCNLSSLPYLSLGSEYINQDRLNAATGNNTVYMIADSLSEYIGSQWCVFYDLELLNQLGFEDPIKAVKDGSWTWDKLLEMSEAAAKLGEGFNGFISYADKTTLLNAVWGSSGISYLGQTHQVPLELKLDAIGAQKNLDLITKLFASKSYGTATKQNALEVFKSGKSLFLIYTLDLAPVIAEKSRTWGMVPLPKVTTEQQNYYSYLDQHVQAVGVPANIVDSERTGVILNALFAASYEHIDEAAKNSYINFYLHNNTSALMLSKIIDNTHLDFAFFYGYGINSIKNNTYNLFADIYKNKLKIEQFENLKVKNGISKEASKLFK